MTRATSRGDSVTVCVCVCVYACICDQIKNIHSRRRTLKEKRSFGNFFSLDANNEGPTGRTAAKHGRRGGKRDFDN